MPSHCFDDLTDFCFVNEYFFVKSNGEVVDGAFCQHKAQYLKQFFINSAKV